jgi:hypothetical protein
MEKDFLGFGFLGGAFFNKKSAPQTPLKKITLFSIRI